MKELTRAEEQVMRVLWSLGRATVGQIRERFDEPRPARTTIATVLTILENKQFATHHSDGRTNIYTPAVERDAYSRAQLFGVMRNYFDGSFASMASFFARETNLSIEELDELLEQTRRELADELKTGEL
jgi:predicted transcriptional regulator